MPKPNFPPHFLVPLISSLFIPFIQYSECYLSSIFHKLQAYIQDSKSRRRMLVCQFSDWTFGVVFRKKSFAKRKRQKSWNVPTPGIQHHVVRALGQSFGGTYCIHFQDRKLAKHETSVPADMSIHKLHSAITQKVATSITTSVRTSNAKKSLFTL
jgi:hypothetical protein